MGSKTPEIARGKSPSRPSASGVIGARQPERRLAQGFASIPAMKRATERTNRRPFASPSRAQSKIARGPGQRTPGGNRPERAPHASPVEPPPCHRRARNRPSRGQPRERGTAGGTEKARTHPSSIGTNRQNLSPRPAPPFRQLTHRAQPRPAAPLVTSRLRSPRWPQCAPACCRSTRRRSAPPPAGSAAPPPQTAPPIRHS